MLKIKEINVRGVKVPMSEPHQTASAIISESPLVLTDVVLENGICGNSILFTYTPAVLKPCADLVSNIAPLLIGEQLAPLAISEMLSAKFRLLGAQGLVGMAVAAIDMALWDALAKANDLPLVNQLGGKIKPMPAYGAIGFDGVNGSARTAERLVAQGFTGVKAKIGYSTLQQDIDVVESIQRVIGEDITLMVDYNQSLNPVEAMLRVEELHGYGLGWIEEPVLAHDFDSLARITSASAIPIQAGENWWGILDMQHAIDSEASDYMMPDVMKMGGVSGWMKAAAMAQAKSIPISNHLWPEVSIHLLCCAGTAHWLEYSDWWNPVLIEPLELIDGMAQPSDKPGSGIQWDESAIEKFQI